MARVIEEELVGYAFTILQGERQKVAEDGELLFNGVAGGPQTEPVWVFVFQAVEESTRHVVRVTFNEEGKNALLTALTGGITVAREMPKGPVAA